MGNMVFIGEIRNFQFVESVDVNRAISIRGLVKGGHNMHHHLPSANVVLTLATSIRFNQCVLQDDIFKDVVEQALQCVEKGTMSAFIPFPELLVFLKRTDVSEKTFKILLSWEDVESVHIQWFQHYSATK